MGRRFVRHISVDSHPNANAPPIANENANQATAPAPAPDSTTAAVSEPLLNLED
ncbi:hypothetical protein QJS04_geneDACA000760 [Acorus gramineus]|uniref:Uncharacterized protein n=1 Tax=Acorus gramineus TaxID=55184 RepID=A0AAV9BII0_ACOGR|nr:hypothetical protein QJS04_geneDACA000760 [Acorus gramineus]